MSNPFDTAFTQFFITDNASFGRKIDLNKLATQVKNSKAKPIVNEFIQGRTDLTLDSKDEYEAFLTTWGNFNLKNGRGKGIDQISASQLSSSDDKTQAEGELRELFFDSTNPQGLTIKADFINSIKPDESVPNNTPPTVTVTQNPTPLTNTDEKTRTLLLKGLLSAEDDVTKAPENLTYTLGDITGGEVKKDTTVLAAGGKFTQKEIDDEKITFVWNGTEPQPKFNFTVSDNNSTPATSTTQTFPVAVTPPTAERNIVLNTPTEATATKAGDTLVLSAKFPTGTTTGKPEDDFYDATQLAGSGLSLNLAITVDGTETKIEVPFKGLNVAAEAQDSTKLNIQIPPAQLSNIKGQITKIDFSASAEPSAAAKTATIEGLNIDFSGNTSTQTPTNNNQNQATVKPDNTATNTTQNTSTNTATTNSSSNASTMNPPPITVGNRTITGSESAVILQAALRNNIDPTTNQPYYSGLITGNWDEPSANALREYIADNTGKPIEKTLPKGTENVSGKLIGSWSSGDDVKAVQQTLNTKLKELKITKLDEDGQFGSQTEAAIRAFQEYYNTNFPQNKIKVDGILGPETELAMNTQFKITLFKTT